MRKSSKNDKKYNDFDESYDEDYLNENNYDDEEYADEYEDEYEDDIDDFDDEVKNESIKKEKKKEIYVKRADLIAEIKKYQDSKATSPNRKGNYLRRAWNDGSKNMH